MIRDFESSDMKDVLAVWLKASITAHNFVEGKFWESKIDDMRERYIPASDTYVFTDNGSIKGFISLHGNTVAAMFVSPEFQGMGIGRQLIKKAKSLKNKLDLTVYRENSKSIDFYRQCGFVTIKERVDEHTGHIEILMEYSS